MNSTGLDNDDIAAIQSIFASYPEIETALLYGSRARGDFKPGSDIDLLLTGKNLSDQTVLDVRAEIRDSNVPYMVDIIAENDINDENMRREIYTKTWTLYSRIPTGDGGGVE
jgi:predicted nucleotidyltransferase